jgi:hypothetical protein
MESPGQRGPIAVRQFDGSDGVSQPEISDQSPESRFRRNIRRPGWTSAFAFATLRPGFCFRCLDPLESLVARFEKLLKRQWLPGDLVQHSSASLFVRHLIV